MKKISKNNLTIIYKLLNVILMISVFALSAFLLTENILPGFISSHLSFLKLTIFIILLVIAISFLGRKLAISFSEEKIKKWLLSIATLFFIINLALALIKFDWINSIIIIATSLLITFYFFKYFKVS